MVLFLREGLGVSAFALAYHVQGVFDRFPVQDAVSVGDAFPGADDAQLGRGDRGLDAEAVQVLEVFAALTTKTAELGKLAYLEPDAAAEPLDDFVGNAWDAVQIVSNPSVARLGVDAMHKVYAIIQDGKIDKSRLREANGAIKNYQ